jgi:hypothetical protein
MHKKLFFHHQKIDLRSQFKPTKKPRPGGLALAFKTLGQAKAVIKPSTMARLGLAYLGLAWPGSRPQAGPSTPLVVVIGS